MTRRLSSIHTSMCRMVASLYLHYITCHKCYNYKVDTKANLDAFPKRWNLIYRITLMLFSFNLRLNYIF